MMYRYLIKDNGREYGLTYKPVSKKVTFGGKSFLVPFMCDFILKYLDDFMTTGKYSQKNKYVYNTEMSRKEFLKLVSKLLAKGIDIKAVETLGRLLY